MQINLLIFCKDNNSNESDVSERDGNSPVQSIDGAADACEWENTKIMQRAKLRHKNSLCYSFIPSSCVECLCFLCWTRRLDPQSHEGPGFSLAELGWSGSPVDEAFTRWQLESDEALISVNKRLTVAFSSQLRPRGAWSFPRKRDSSSETS